MDSEWIVPAVMGGFALVATLLSTDREFAQDLVMRVLLMLIAGFFLLVAIVTGGEILSRILAA